MKPQCRPDELDRYECCRLHVELTLLGVWTSVLTSPARECFTLSHGAVYEAQSNYGLCSSPTERLQSHRQPVHAFAWLMSPAEHLLPAAAAAAAAADAHADAVRDAAGHTDAP